MLFSQAMLQKLPALASSSAAHNRHPSGCVPFFLCLKIFFIFAFQKLKFRQSGKADIAPIFNRTAKKKVLNPLELLGFRISVSGFEFANFSAMIRLRSNDRRFAE